MTLRRVPERLDERVALERRLYHPPLDTASAPVNQSHFPQPRAGSRVHVLFDHGGDILRSKAVKVERVLDGNVH